MYELPTAWATRLPGCPGGFFDTITKKIGGTMMQKLSLEQELKNNAYPGRGIVIGKSPNGKYAVTAYFIMGRSENSRNRVFVNDGEGIRTQAFDPSKLSDPSLIIYAPVRVLGNKTIVTNGDQTDTIYELMDKQQTFLSRRSAQENLNRTVRIIHQEFPALCMWKTESTIMQCLFLKAITEIRMPAIVILSHMRIRKQERGILFIHICVTEIHCQVLRASQNGLKQWMI